MFVCVLLVVFLVLYFGVCTSFGKKNHNELSDTFANTNFIGLIFRAQDMKCEHSRIVIRASKYYSFHIVCSTSPKWCFNFKAKKKGMIY